MNGAEEHLDLRSLCSFSIGTLLWQQRPREWSLSLCVKGTFVLTPGADAVLAEVQRPIQVSRARGTTAAMPTPRSPATSCPSNLARMSS